MNIYEKASDDYHDGHFILCEKCYCLLSTEGLSATSAEKHTLCAACGYTESVYWFKVVPSEEWLIPFKVGFRAGMQRGYEGNFKFDYLNEE